MILFKASHGWLDKWKKRYNVKYLKICGESGDVHNETMKSSKERLPEIVQAYDNDNIWNMDESGLFFKHYLIMAFTTKVRNVMVVKKQAENNSSGHKKN